MYVDLSENQITNSIDGTNGGLIVQKTTGTRNFDMFKNFENLGGHVNKNKIQKALIKKYREYFEFPKVFEAVMDIINSLVPLKDEDVVELIIEKIEKIENLDPQILKSAKKNLPFLFESIKRKMVFDRYGNQYALDWYVDSGLWIYFQVDSKKKLGITEIRMLDPLKLELVEENNTFVYLYPKDEEDINNETLMEKIPYNRVLFIPSGLRDADTGINIGYLNKAIRPINLLSMMENSLVVYRFVRAPERWVFKIDVSGMNSKRARSHIKQMQEKYRSRYTIDAITGELKSQANVMAMQENFWLAKTESQNGGHEIDTVGGNVSNLGEIDDILYFQKEVYKSLHVPISRLEPDSTFNFGGRTEEISRDEMKFQSFIKRLRMFFNQLFLQLLKIECVYTSSLKEDEFDEIVNDLVFRYESDSVYEMARKRADLETMFDLASQYEEIVKKYKGEDYFRKEFLRETDKEIKMYKEIVRKEKEEREKENGSEDEEENSNTTFVKHKKSFNPSDLEKKNSTDQEEE